MPTTRMLNGGAWLAALLLAGLVGCASGPQVTPIEDVSHSDEGPFDNVLVVCLAESFDMRRYLETELVSQLEGSGTRAVASTSMMNSKTPAVAATFIDMVRKTGADAVLLTQPVQLESRGSEVAVNPEATYIFRPTYYYNVFLVELDEYVEPPEVRFEHDVTLLTEMISVRTRQPVWAVHTHSKIVWQAEMERDYSAYVDVAHAITRELVNDGIVAH